MWKSEEALQFAIALWLRSLHSAVAKIRGLPKFAKTCPRLAAVIERFDETLMVLERKQDHLRRCLSTTLENIRPDEVNTSENLSDPTTVTTALAPRRSLLG